VNKKEPSLDRPRDGSFTRHPFKTDLDYALMRLITRYRLSFLACAGLGVLESLAKARCTAPLMLATSDCRPRGSAPAEKLGGLNQRGGSLRHHEEKDLATRSTTGDFADPFRRADKARDAPVRASENSR
jgi:hypothetical protein